LDARWGCSERGWHLQHLLQQAQDGFIARAAVGKVHQPARARVWASNDHNTAVGERQRHPSSDVSATSSTESGRVTWNM
jgi:hypothetical protein